MSRALALLVLASCSLTDVPDPAPKPTPTVPEGCAEDEKVCGEACVAIGDPATGCSAEACDPCFGGAPAQCVQGACACLAGFTDCDGNASNGCEVDTASDPANCSACGVVCTVAFATAACVDGQCAIGTCDPGRADCNGELDDGCELDTDIDPVNCGACGRDCLGGACSGGACEVLVLSTQPNAPWGIDNDGAYLYWSNRLALGSISRQPITDAFPPPQPEFLVQSEPWPADVLVHAGNLYWNADMEIRTAPAAPPTAAATFSPATCQSTLAATNTHLFWGEVDFPAGCTSDEGLFAAELATGSATQPPRFSQLQAFVMGVAADGDHVYWTETPGRVMRADLNGEEALFDDAAAMPRHVDADGTMVFFAAGPTSGPARIYAVDAGDIAAGAQLLAEHAAGSAALDLRVDDSHVYWCDDSSINRVARAGGAVEVLAADQAPRDLTLDGKSVFWTDLGGTASIKRIAK